MTPGIGADSGDVCLPFVLSGGSFRGRIVRLTHAAGEILGAHKDPEPVATLLAEAMAAAVALAGGLKYTGVFTLQIQGKGPVRTLVTDVTSGGDVRGCVKYDAAELAVEMARPRPGGAPPHLLGLGGHLAFTVDQGPDTERYQGIVELAGETLAEAVHHYFRQSEQIETALKIAAAPAADGQWTASAVLIQRMPDAGGEALPMPPEERDDLWRTSVILLSSLKDSELLDLTLTPERLVYRLFATVDVRFSTARPVAAKCRCSRERSERILASFPVDEVKSFAENGEIHMTCEFCRTDYIFLESELGELAHRHQAQPTRTES